MITSGLEFYFGYDIVDELVRQNLSRCSQPNHFFRTADISVDLLPKADAILCRDCLVHLPLESGVEIISNFIEAGSTYLMLTTFPALEKNRVSGAGGWRPLNMSLPPFDLPPPLRLIRERHLDPLDKYNDKSLGIWRVSDLTIFRTLIVQSNFGSHPT